MPTDFITYAQNAEDVILWRALQHVRNGFYIDVGAQDPIVDSVTKAFYERGWRGINIEPVEYWYQRLTEDRPHDINLRVAASDRSGEEVLFEVKGTGLSTTNSAYAAGDEESGREVREVRVRCRTLDDICAEYDVHSVQFLKIDCEGAERQTLTGLSLLTVRPWIVVVEATEPNTLKPTHQHWEHLLVHRGYEFVYFDGLNRFYLANEHGELRNAFGAPPNPIEWAERAAVIRASQRSQQLEEQLTQLRSGERVVRAEADRDHWREECDRRERAILDLQAQTEAMSRELARVQRECAVLLDRQAGVARAKHDLAQQVSDLARAKHDLTQQVSELLDALARGRAEYEVCSGELARVYTSHSWKITAPLRAVRRVFSNGIGSGVSIRRTARAVLRPPLRALRPAMRKLSRYEAARALVVGVLGRHSTIVRHARLFLFGAPPMQPPESPCATAETWTSSHPVSSREGAVLDALNIARARAAKGK